MALLIKKGLLAIMSALTGLILIPILAFEMNFIGILPILIIFFLPVYSLALIFLFELITRIKALHSIYNFIYGYRIFYIFFWLLVVEWIIMWKIDPLYDVVFALQFTTGTIPAMIVYARLGNKWNIVQVNATNVRG